MAANSTKSRRARLFRKSRPNIRPYTKEDFWVLWAAYDLGSFPNLPKGLDKDKFSKFVKSVILSNSSCLVIDEDCKWFKNKRGPVCFITLRTNGWKVEPNVDFFMWATPRMKLRCVAAFFQMVRYSRDVGICLVTALANSVCILNHMKKYGLLFPVGRIPDGSPRGDEFQYIIRGRKT